MMVTCLVILRGSRNVLILSRFKSLISVPKFLLQKLRIMEKLDLIAKANDERGTCEDLTGAIFSDLSKLCKSLNVTLIGVDIA